MPEAARIGPYTNVVGFYVSRLFRFRRTIPAPFVASSAFAYGACVQFR